MTRAKGHNRTANRRAVENPRTRKAILDLKNSWPHLDQVSRGERLEKLVSEGCSTRGLQGELGQSATSIRRHLEIAGLPKAEREAIKAGVSAKQVLSTKHRKKRKQKMRDRILLDRQTGEVSNEVATLILEFCRVKEDELKVPVLRVDFELLLQETAEYLKEAERKRARGAEGGKESRELFRSLRPEPKKDEFWVQHYARWLASIVRSIAPEEEIQQRSIEKAMHRSSELVPNSSIREILRNAWRKSEYFQTGPKPRKRYTPVTNRKSRPQGS